MPTPPSPSQDSRPHRFKHERVEAEIRQLLRTLAVGARLPAERSLAATYKCNFLTVRRALKQLVDEGLVVRRTGSGTFVARRIDTSPPGGERADKLALLVLPTSDAYASRLLQAIAQAGLEEGIEVVSRWVRDFKSIPISQIEQLGEEGCAALVLPWFPYSMVDEVRDFVQRSPLAVSLPMAISGLERNCFMEPARFGDATQRATETLYNYFKGMGGRRIAFLGPDTPTDVILQKALSAYACRASRDESANLCGLVQPGTRAMDRLASRWAAYKGDLSIISYDDAHALRFMTAMHKLGLGAPGDYRIVGYNDTEASAYSDPPLSTIRQNFGDISHWLLKSALALSRGQVSQSKGCPRSRLVVRDTCGGKDRIDETWRTRLPTLDFILTKPDPEIEAESEAPAEVADGAKT